MHMTNAENNKRTFSDPGLKKLILSHQMVSHYVGTLPYSGQCMQSVNVGFFNQCKIDTSLVCGLGSPDITISNVECGHANYTCYLGLHAKFFQLSVA